MWVVDSLHIHAPLSDTESMVLEKATRHARMFGNPNVLVDVKMDNRSRCVCNVPPQLNFYHLILHYWE